MTINKNDLDNSIGFSLLKESAIKPSIATMGSAGYDISIPTDFEPRWLKPGECIKIPTGVAAFMPKGIVLLLYVRSSVGIKKGCVLMNGTGVIDSDYYGNPSNGGEILIALRNESDNECLLSPGDKLIQGVFTNYYLTTEDTIKMENEIIDEVFATRQGGIGSTDIGSIQLNA